MIERWEFPESNAQQQYATHGFFRYFGKLPPVVTRRILEESRRYLAAGPGVDVACGSGTTLVEALLLAMPFEGIDINPLSVLATRVKTHPIPVSILDREWHALSAWVQATLGKVARRGLTPGLRAAIPNFSRRDLWFTKAVQQELAVLCCGVHRVKHAGARDFFTLALAATIRRASNASERAGRIFKEVGKVPPRPWSLMQQKVDRMRRDALQFGAHVNGYYPPVHVADAKETGLPGGRYGLVFFHPPYFALYKYSSDVLRFELEWLGFNRKEIGRREIRDGFKTTRAEDVELYLDDLGAILAEGRRLVHRRGAMVVVSNNSTLRKRELPIIPSIQQRAETVGFRLARHCIRTVRFAQASYHRSADEDIRTPRDHILFFEPI